MAHATSLYQPNSFPTFAFKTMLERLAVAWGCTVRELKFTAYYSHDNASEKRDITFDEAAAAGGVVPPLDHLLVHYDIGGRESRLASFTRGPDGSLGIFVEASDMIRARKVLNLIADAFEVQPHESVSRLGDIEARLAALERRASAAPLRCFLSFRFSAESSSVAREIETYLSLLGVEVVSGIEYEPRRVEDKVRDRLLSGVDFVVYLVTSDGESSWLRDELATAKTSGAIPVPLVEDGSHLDAGLLGNIESIPFAQGHPGDCWIRLAQAVRYVEAARLEAGVSPVEE